MTKIILTVSFKHGVQLVSELSYSMSVYSMSVVVFSPAVFMPQPLFDAPCFH